DQTVSRSFNRWGQVISETDDRGNVTRYEYTLNGIPTATIDPLGRTTFFEYDSQDQLTAIRTAVGEATYLAYNDFGQVIEIRSGGPSAIDGPADELADEPIGSQSVQFVYNRFGDLESLTDADRRTRSMEYD